MTTYKIIRFSRKSGRTKTIRRGLSLADAQQWCSRPDTHKIGSDGCPIWFDGFTKECE